MATNTVDRIEYQPGSGIALVHFIDGTFIPCDAGPLCRSGLEAGETIHYSSASFGTMESFSYDDSGEE